MRPATTEIHGGYSGADHGAGSVPIYQTAAFVYPSAGELAAVFRGQAPGHVYTRISNPTTYVLECRLAELEGGVGCIATASGMGAIAAVAAALLSQGDHVVSAGGIFGGTTSLFTNVFARFGVTTTFVPASAPEAFRDAITPETKMVFTETITNPTMEVPDLAVLGGICRSANIPLVVDGTVTTPALCRHGELGADIVVHSTTKFINGHGTAIGGAIIDTGRYRWRDGIFVDIQKMARRAGDMALLARLRNVVYRDLGMCPAPQNSFLMLQGLETLSHRMKVHCRNAAELADFLETRPEVAWINYPGLASSPYRPLIDRQFGGMGGGILTFGLKNGDAALRCIDRLRLARRMTNLGDAKTLVLHPASTIFAEYAPEQRRSMGVGDELIRVSVGLEDIEDLRQDFGQALVTIGKEHS